jgi:hypothetical protein
MFLMPRTAKRSTSNSTPSRARTRSRAPRPWTKDDIRQLKALAGAMPKARIARTLRRSEAAVTFKAFTLRLSLAQRSRGRARR